MPERFHENETLLILLVAMIAPAVAVFLMRGCGHEVLICFLLGLLFFFPGQIYAFCLVAEHARQLKQKTGKPIVVVENPAQLAKSNVVQVTSSTPPVVQTIEYKPPSAAPPPPTPVSSTPAAPAPAPPPAPPTVTEQVVVVTKSPDKAPEKAPEAPPVDPAPAAAK
ncbi:hypothetical protein KCU81_g8914, partial [Aureobasidium melanogenum]|uniref:Uncharacterized protein n=1 Tax=Aureobasidium melanogenum (strain CBS 110374) TaxID=1043003 RepID=A0A074VQ13_AURM1